MIRRAHAAFALVGWACTVGTAACGESNTPVSGTGGVAGHQENSGGAGRGSAGLGSAGRSGAGLGSAGRSGAGLGSAGLGGAGLSGAGRSGAQSRGGSGPLGGSGATSGGSDPRGSAGNGGNGAAGAGPGVSPQLGGCSIFPPNDDWNLDISTLNADPEWTARLLTWVGSDRRLHPDFGGAEYGIPINIVPENQTAVDVALDDWPEESDSPPFPFPGPTTAQIEGGTPTDCSGDCHVLVLQQGLCKVYEAWACAYSDRWHCSNAAAWDLNRASYGQRPVGWTSADAAGLSVLAGLLRYDEVMAHDVRHAIRFTTSCSINKYVRPATHQAVPSRCDPQDPNAPPMGLRVRMKAGFQETGYSAETRAVIAAFKKHGMILADNGSDYYFQGERNAAWPETLIDELKQIPADAFEVVDVPPLQP